MKTSMIINRMENWFDSTDAELDESFLAIQMLERLSTRKKVGLDYDRFKLASILYDRSSFEAIDAIDKSIVLLISRKLIRLQTQKGGKRKLFITEIGELAYKTYKEEMKK